MSQKYKYDIMLNKIDTAIKTLEANENNSQEDIDKVVALYNKAMKLNNYESYEVQELIDRLEVFAPDFIAKVEEENEMQNLYAISPKSYKIKKNTLKSAIAGGIFALAVTSVASCSLRNDANVVPETVVETETETFEPIVETKILPENLSFDPNDNIELVNRLSDFIGDAITKGIPVKDVMTEEEIKLAEENEESLVTIEQLVDFYLVMNIEDIDPVDYARLGYNTKTAETITDNYMYCARIFMTDTLTANNSTKIDYSNIIADKDSSEAIQEFINYLVNYNDSENKKELGSEIKEFIISNYINRDANIYSMSANEFTYRMMFVADMISNNSILPNDVNVILNEDGKISCDLKKEDGIKNKTEKAEEFTSIYNTVDEKLEISREFINQDLNNISESELKTGYELEKEIKEKVLIMNVSYKLNPKFDNSIEILNKKSNTKGYKTFIDANGNRINIPLDELDKYGVTNLDDYEAAKRKEFEENAKKDPNHTIKDPDGNEVVRGEDADPAKYNEGFAAGYSDGNKYNSKNPKSSNKSYLAGYEAGYAQGLADRKALDESLKEPPSDFDPVEPSEPEEPSTEAPSEEPPSEEPSEEEPTEEFTEEFVPLDSAEEATYTSSINNLKSLREELLKMSNAYTEEVSKIRC